MNSEENIENFDDVTACPVCFDTFKTPRCIPCLHTFCHNCLHKHIVTTCAKKTSPIGFHCPICEDFVPDPAKCEEPEKWAECFPKNLAVEFIITNGGNAALKHCKPCQNDNEEQEAIEVCRTCMEPLCKMCAKYHRRGTVTRDHEVIPVHEFRKSVHAGEQEMVCEEHQSRPMDIFCYDHKIPCCIVCSIDEHNACENKDTIENEAQVIEEEGEEEFMLSEIENIYRHLQKFKKLQENNRTKMEDKADKITEETKKIRRQIIEKLDSLENAHLEGLAKVMKTARKTIDENVEFISDLLDFSNHCKRKLQSIKNKKHHSSYVHGFHHVRKQVKRLKNTNISVKEIDLSVAFSDIFRQFNNTGQFAYLSHHHEKSRRLSINMIQNIRKSELEIIRKRAFKSTAGSISFACMLENGDCLALFYERRTCLIISNQITKDLQAISTACKPLFGVVFKEYIYVVGKEKFINIIDLNSSRTNRTIAIQEQCFGLSIHQDSLFMVCWNSVKQLDADGVVRKTIPVQCPSKHLVFLENENIVYLKHDTDRKLQPTAINQEGQKLWVYDHPELIRPSGLAKDFAENFYIPCYESNSIHVISSIGGVLNIFKNINHPSGISFREDCYEFSVVSEWNSVIVFRMLEKNY